MSAADLLRRALAALPTADTEGAKLIAQAVEQLASEDDMRSRRIERERRRLNKASAVLTGAVLACEQGVHREIVADAIAAGRELIDAAIRALDSVTLSGGAS